MKLDIALNTTIIMSSSWQWHDLLCGESMKWKLCSLWWTKSSHELAWNRGDQFDVIVTNTDDDNLRRKCPSSSVPSPASDKPAWILSKSMNLVENRVGTTVLNLLTNWFRLLADFMTEPSRAMRATSLHWKGRFTFVWQAHWKKFENLCVELWSEPARLQHRQAMGKSANLQNILKLKTHKMQQTVCVCQVLYLSHDFVIVGKFSLFYSAHIFQDKPHLGDQQSDAELAERGV